MMLWLLSAASAVLAWLLWLFRPRPVPESPVRADPYAGEIAEFRRQVGDWCRG